jgi:hypothetical protein
MVEDDINQMFPSNKVRCTLLQRVNMAPVIAVSSGVG